MLDVSPSDPLVILVFSSPESAATFCSFRFVFLEWLAFVGVDVKTGVIAIANSVKKKRKKFSLDSQLISSETTLNEQLLEK